MPKKRKHAFSLNKNISISQPKTCFLLLWYAVMLGVSSAATMGTRFFNTGLTQSLAKRDMFRAGDIPLMFRGRQTRECIGSLVPKQCSKSHMQLPNFVRSLAFSSASQSSGQTPRQEPNKKENKIIRKEICDEKISSTKVSLINQFPGLMVHGMAKNSKTRRLLQLNPDTGYFEQEQDVAAAAANHDHHSNHNELQVPHGHVCRGSAYGWLFLTDENLDMKLFNPFTGAEIQLPPMKTIPRSKQNPRRLSPWFVYKAVFSANPSVEPRPVVLIYYAGQLNLAFCKPGDKGWTPLEFPIERHFQWCYVYPRDVIYHKDQFYVLSHPGYVAAFDIGRRIDDDDHSVKTTLVATAAKRELIYGRDWRLVVLDEELVRFEFKSACFCDCCIEETKRKMEQERVRDGDTTDEDYTNAASDEDYDFNYADADEDTDTETDFSDSDSDEDTDTETDSDSDSRDENENENENENEDEDDDDDDDDNKEEEKEKEEDEKDEVNLPCVDLNLPSLTYGIKIRRFDVSEQQWVKVESLGDKAVFLGYNTSFVVSASDYPAGHCIPNSIYFTFGGFGNELTEMVCYDMGIYNVKDKSVKRPLYLPTPTDDDDDVSQFKKPAPIWIVNSAS